MAATWGAADLEVRPHQPLDETVNPMNMKRLLRILGSGALLAASLLAGCAKAPVDDPRRPVLNTYADIVLATYEDTLQAAKALDASVDALLAAPSERTLADARDKWRAARIPYDQSEAFRFYGGPIDREGGPEGQLNGWPLDENHIDAVGSGYNAAPGLNIVGNPAVSIPIEPLDGLPVGMQIIGRHHEDQLLLDLAAVVERERPWPLVAPGSPI